MTEICFLRMGATALFLPAGGGEFGGAEVRAFTFARELAQRGHPVEFAVAPHAQLPPSSPDNIRIVPLAPRPRGMQKLVGSLRKRWTTTPASFAGLADIKADVIACFGIHSPTPQVIAAAPQSGKQTILFLTSSEDVSLPRPASKRELRRQQHHRFAIENADAIVVQTETQRQQLERNFGRDGTLIRNPIDTHVAEDALLHYRRHVLWVGRADQDSKRADICFELARICPEVPFHVVMNGGDAQFLQTLMAQKPDNVSVDTFVPLERIEELYATASVLLNTSDSEGFPNAFLQAMKYRTPILSLTVDPDDVISRVACGQVAGSLPRMAECLRDYWPRSPLSVRQGKLGRQYLCQHHELADQVNKLELLTEAMFGGSATSRTILSIAQKRPA